jgi:DNA-binding XRE family transcriptional regulator
MSNARITPGQVKAARRLLGLWQSDLAKMVRLSEKSIRDFESGELFGTSLDLDLVREALESAGVEFIAIGSAPDVRLQEVSEKTDRPKAGLDPIDQARLRAEVRIEVDAWIATQPEPRPTRSEAIWRLLEEALAKEAKAEEGRVRARHLIAPARNN